MEIEAVSGPSKPGTWQLTCRIYGGSRLLGYPQRVALKFAPHIERSMVLRRLGDIVVGMPLSGLIRLVDNKWIRARRPKTVLEPSLKMQSEK